MTSLLRTIFLKEKSLKHEYPDLYQTYEEITSNTPILKKIENFSKDDEFLIKHKLYSNDFSEPLLIIFLETNNEKKQTEEIIANMRKIEERLRAKICKFATRKSIMINKVYPEILNLDKMSLNIKKSCQEMRNEIINNQKKIMRMNETIERKMKKKKMLILYLEMLKKKSINAGYVDVEEVTDQQYLLKLSKNISKIHIHEYLLAPENLYQNKTNQKNKFFFYYSYILQNFNSKKFFRILEFLRDMQKNNCFGRIENTIPKCFSFALKLTVVKNLRKSLFDDDFNNINTSQIYLVNDFLKLEILLPMMSSNNLCFFLNKLLSDFQNLFESINIQIFHLYKYSSFKKDEYYDSLLELFFKQKVAIGIQISKILETILKSINLKELGEMGAKAFLSFLLKYEEFLLNLQKFSCHFPMVPNKLIFNLINEYIKYFKEKSLRTIFHELLDENWSILLVNAQIFKEKIMSYIIMKEEFLQLTKLFDEELLEEGKKMKEKVLNYSLCKIQDSETQPENVNKYILPTSTHKTNLRSDKIICRSAMTVTTIMADYAKFCGVFKNHRDIILEDCNFLMNVWVFTALLKFVPVKWMKQLINFSENIYPENPEIAFVENLHSFFIFKFKFKELRRFFFNFNLQFLSLSDKFQVYFKGFIKSVIKENTEQIKNTKEMILALKSLKYVICNFQYLDTENEHMIQEELFVCFEVFFMQYFFLEKYRKHTVFEKLLSFKWNSVKNLIMLDNNPYLFSFLGLLDEVDFEFNNNLEDLKLEKIDVKNYIYYICDMLLMTLIEVYSQNYNCNVMGRMQMKFDLNEILMKLDKILGGFHSKKLREKYNGFIEVFFINASKDVYKYSMENFYEIPFALSKALLLSNVQKETNFNSKNELYMTPEQQTILKYAKDKFYKKIKEDCEKEDFLKKNILLESLEIKEYTEEETLKVLFKFLKIN